MVIDNPEIFYLHRVNDDQDVFFFVNSTFTVQTAQVTLHASRTPMLWDPSTGQSRPAVPARFVDNQVSFPIQLPPAGSLFVLPGAEDAPRILDTNLVIDRVERGEISGYGDGPRGYVFVELDGRQTRLETILEKKDGSTPLTFDGQWEFIPQNDNALVIERWQSCQETSPDQAERFAAADPG